MNAQAAVSPTRDRILELRRVSAAELRANPRNWRRHPATQARALRSVLEKVGYAGALLARETPDGLELIDGHLRQELAGSERVPVLVLDVDEEEAGLILATLDPLGAMAVTDEQALYDLLQSVQIPDDVLAQALEEMTGQAGPPIASGDPDEVPEPPAEPITQVGDLWTMGEHRLLCGDSSESAVLDRLLGSDRVACLLTDPPYGINLDTDYSPGNGRVYRAVAGDDVAFDAAALRARFRDVGEQFWFGANYYRRSLGGTDRDGSWLVWDKRDAATDVVVGSGFELIWSATPHKQDILRFMWTNFTSHTNDGMGREHPTEKPVALLAEILRRWAPDGPVLDPFAGSGTMMIAAEQTGRPCYMVEIDPAYCDVIAQRWETFTGKTAERVADADTVQVHG